MSRSKKMKLTLPSGAEVTGTPAQIAELTEKLKLGVPQCSFCDSGTCYVHGKYVPDQTYTIPTDKIYVARPCRTCSGVIGIVGPWTCSECGTSYGSNEIFCSTSSAVMGGVVPTH